MTYCFGPQILVCVVTFQFYDLRNFIEKFTFNEIECDYLLLLLLIGNKCNGKMKTKWKGDFFLKKNLRLQFDRLINSESNGSIFSSLARSGGNFFCTTGRVKNSTQAPPNFTCFHKYIYPE